MMLDCHRVYRHSGGLEFVSAPDQVQSRAPLWSINHRATSRRLPVHNSIMGKLTFIGLGLGDPKDITLKGSASVDCL